MDPQRDGLSPPLLQLFKELPPDRLELYLGYVQQESQRRWQWAARGQWLLFVVFLATISAATWLGLVGRTVECASVAGIVGLPSVGLLVAQQAVRTTRSRREKPGDAVRGIPPE